MLTMKKYPRTPHLQGSRLQPGDEDLDSVPFEEIRGRFIVVEEKIDGANSGIRFDGAGALWLQSRGHFLTGGVREKHFNLFKQWATAHAPVFLEVLSDRYSLYGEWLYAKHTVYYDRLPHYFLEFDVLDHERDCFLSTAERRALLAGLPIVSVPVLYEGPGLTLKHLTDLVGKSAYKSPTWRDNLRKTAEERNVDPDLALKETDNADVMEGLYIKVEENGRVVERYKWVRAGFLNSILDSGTHWLARPIVPNGLAPDVDLFGSGK